MCGVERRIFNILASGTVRYRETSKRAVTREYKFITGHTERVANLNNFHS